MKRSILFVALCCLVIPAFSQVSVGITGGYSLAKFHPRENSYPQYNSYSFVSRWHAGIIAETRIAGSFYAQPQLLVSRKGSSDQSKSVTPVGGYSRTILSPTYLELPIDLVYKRQVGIGQLYAGAGPYVARGLGGKSVLKSKIPTPYGEWENENKQKIVFNSHPPEVSDFTKMYARPWDLGINFIGGYQLKNGLLLNINYSMGLSGFYNEGDFYKNRYWGLSAGWFFF